MRENIYVTKPFLPSKEEYMEQISSMWESHMLTNAGNIHNELELKLREYFGTEECVLSVNGHMALEMLLQAMKLKGEVITTPFTFASTTHAIVRNGLIPVFADINEEDYTIDPESVERLVTDRTCAILPVHVYGNVCNVERLQHIADKYHLKLIYDAAHAFGVAYRGRPIGCYGDASVFSFHATKAFHTVEGGAVVTKDHILGDTIRHMRNFGICQDNEECMEIGMNGKMSEFHAAMGLCNLKHINEITEKRKLVVERYYSHLDKVKGIRTHKADMQIQQNYAYFPIIIEREKYGECRDELCQRLQDEGIFARKYFYPLTKKLACYGNDFSRDGTPVADYISASVLALPLYADLSFQDVDRICNIISRK